MKLEEAIRIMDLFVKNIAVENVKVFELKNACKVALQELEHLQKENEELKDIDLTIVHLKGVCDEKERWRNKIREIINNKRKRKFDIE